MRQAGTPKSIRYLDIDGVAVAEETATGFGDATVRVLRERDGFGRVKFESVPSYGWERTFGTHMRYDTAGRVIAKWQTKTSLAGTGGLVEHLLTRYAHHGLRTCINVEVTNDAGGYALPASCPTSSASSPSRLVMSRDIGSDGKPIRTRDALLGVTGFWYDGAGNAIALRDAKNVVTSATYDDLGRRLTSDDPNQGIHAFTYDGLGQLHTATDARDWVTTTRYDALGRVVNRTAIEGIGPSAPQVVDAYAYDQRGAGLLDSESRTVLATAGGDNEYTQRTYTYDKYYRPTHINATFGTDTNALVWKQAYDRRFGRVKQTTWPRPAGAPLVSVGYRYNAAGFLSGEFRPQDQADTERFIRRVTEVDARLQPTRIELGAISGPRTMTRVVETDAASGMTTRVCVGALDGSSCALPGYSGSILDIGYRYDGYGNVVAQDQRGAREAAGTDVITESYEYDALHRLEVMRGPSAAALQLPLIRFDYDAVGNLLAKGDFSKPLESTAPYAYGSGRNAKANATDGGPNAVMSVKLRTGTCDMRYEYDNNGNRTKREWLGSCGETNGLVERSFYSSTNHLKRIETGTSGYPRSTFRYGPDGQRYEQVLALDAGSTRTTRYFQGFEHDWTQNDGVRHEYRYEVAQGVLFLGGARSGFHFVHGDRLGSTSTVTNASGGDAKRHAFGAFGEPRDSSWVQTGTMQTGLRGTEADLTAPLVTRRGFTQHEQMDRFRLTHMNGRVYDYDLGRFLSVDPIIQFPTKSQGLNPYSYVLNNPLAGTDPTGYQVAADTSSLCQKNPSACGGVRTVGLPDWGNSDNGAKHNIGARQREQSSPETIGEPGRPSSTPQTPGDNKSGYPVTDVVVVTATVPAPEPLGPGRALLYGGFVFLMEQSPIQYFFTDARAALDKQRYTNGGHFVHDVTQPMLAVGEVVGAIRNPGAAAAKSGKWVDDAADAARAGATIFKTAHYANRLEKAGVNVARAEAAVANEVQAIRGSMIVGGDVAGRMRIDDVLVEYRARMLPDGSVNVGTIFPVAP